MAATTPAISNRILTISPAFTPLETLVSNAIEPTVETIEIIPLLIVSHESFPRSSNALATVFKPIPRRIIEAVDASAPLVSFFARDFIDLHNITIDAPNPAKPLINDSIDIDPS